MYPSEGHEEEGEERERKHLNQKKKEKKKKKEEASTNEREADENRSDNPSYLGLDSSFPAMTNESTITPLDLTPG